MYYIRDGVLQVTYDGGETFKEVKDGYEMVCITPNGTYDELLMENSYIVTPEFTGLNPSFETISSAIGICI